MTLAKLLNRTIHVFHEQVQQAISNKTKKSFKAWFNSAIVQKEEESIVKNLKQGLFIRAHEAQVSNLVLASVSAVMQLKFYYIT